MLLVGVLSASVVYLSPSSNHLNEGGNNITALINLSGKTLDNISYEFETSDYLIYNKDLKLMLNFDGDLNDLSSYDRTISCAKGNCNNFIEGKYVNALKLDGTQYMSVIGGVDKTITEITVSGWFNIDENSNGTLMQIGGIRTGGKNYGFTLSINNATDKFWLRLGNGSETTDGAIFENIYQDNLWHFITLSYNKTIAKIYIDGIEKNSTDIISGDLAYNDSYLDWTFGARKYGQTIDNYFNGSLDEIKVWSRSLSAEEIENQYYSSLRKLSDDEWIFFKNQTVGVDYINYSLNGGTTWTDFSENDTSFNLISDGIYVLVYYTVDNKGNVESEKTETIMIDTTTPTTINSPASNSWQNSNFQLDVTDIDTESGLAMCQYIVKSKIDSGWEITKNWTLRDCNTLTPEIIVGIEGECAIEGKSGNGLCGVFVNSSDNEGNHGGTSRYFAIDYTPPTTTINQAPTQIYNWTNREQIINFSASDDVSGLNSCSLFVDGELVTATNESNTFNYTSSYDAGTHNWSMTCTDNAVNSNITETQFFTILANQTYADNFTDYTDLTQESNISNVTYFYINNSYGMINFSESIDFSSGFDWTQFIEMIQNSIYVNSSGEPELNKSAILKFYNITFITPKVLKDNSTYCIGSACAGYDYNTMTNILTIEITGFSTYEVVEGYVAPVTTTLLSSSGGTGGSSSCVYDSDYDWQCSDWSTCIDGTQTRSCKTSNNCGNSYGKPSTEQSCTMPVVEETTTEEETLSEENTGVVSGITGAVTGFTGTRTGKFILIFIGIILLARIVVIVYRLIKKKNISKKR